MKKALLAAALMMVALFVEAQLKGLKEKVLGGGGGNPLAGLLSKPPAISTSFDDVNMTGALPETFGDEKTYVPMYKMKTAPGGGFILCPGFYSMTNMSYCLKAGTHGPSQGDGYMYTVTRGKMEDVVNSILANHAFKHPEIPQQDVQVILWAIIAHAKFENLSNRLKLVVSQLLTPQQVVKLNGGVVATLSDATISKGIIDMPPAAQKVIQAENSIRRLVETGMDNYEDFERLAILGGMAPVDRPDVKRGMWSLHPDGYYVRYLPSGYSKTTVQVYVPENIKQVIYNAVGTIACPANTSAQRLAQTNIPLDKEDIPFVDPCFPQAGNETPPVKDTTPPENTPPLLKGYADLHTHPMSYLGFGRKAMHGVPDIGSLVPAGTRGCTPAFRASSVADALGDCNASHGGWGVDNPCGDYIRAGIINYAMDDKFVYKTDNIHGDHQHAGYPGFAFWPNQTSILHQQMWWEWIKRAYQGGLRVMVALAVNNELLAEILNGEQPYDDKSVANLQIDETISFVKRHNDFMEIAYSAADVRRIVGNNKLAVILGIEVDKLGNFGKPGVVTTEASIRAEITRLYQKGIRYAFPIHLIDNSFGGTAVSDMLFNFANKRANGYHFRIIPSSDPLVKYSANLTDGPLGFENRLIFGLRGFLEQLGELPAPCFNDAIKCFPPPGKIRCCGSYESVLQVFNPSPELDLYKFIPGGHVNSVGLTSLGIAAVDQMMKLGIMIDVDHMSELSMTKVIEMAEAVPGGYPLLMGHNGIRGEEGTERGAPVALVNRLAALGGMFGVGTADINSTKFVENYRAVWGAMGDQGIAIGTDADGFEPLPKYERAVSQSASNQFYTQFFLDPMNVSIREKSGITGLPRQWDYVLEKGAAHYGLMPEFLFEVKYAAGGADVIGQLMRSAEFFAQLWQKCETVSKSVK